MTLWADFLRRMMLGATPTPTPPGGADGATPPATGHGEAPQASDELVAAEAEPDR